MDAELEDKYGALADEVSAELIQMSAEKVDGMVNPMRVKRPKVIPGKKNRLKTICRFRSNRVCS